MNRLSFSPCVHGRASRKRTQLNSSALNVTVMVEALIARAAHAGHSRKDVLSISPAATLGSNFLIFATAL
jgi:hypothetical protein